MNFSGFGYTGFQEMDAGCFQDRIGKLVGSGFRLDFQDLDLDVWIWIRLLSLGYWRRS